MSEEKALETKQKEREFTPSEIELIKTTIARDATNLELQLFLHQCTRTGLDPFARQIYAIKRWDSRLGRQAMAIQISIDGSRLVADRTGTYAPGKEPSFTYGQEESLKAATAYGWKLVAGRWFEVSATAYWDEYVQFTKEGKPTRFWNKMPHNQLAKCAEALLLRRCCPQELSGLYTGVEMEQADIIDAKGGVVHIEGESHVVNEDIDFPPTKLTFGKYRGKTLLEVLKEDSGYVDWLSKNAKYPELRMEAQGLLEQHQTELQAQADEIVSQSQSTLNETPTYGGWKWLSLELTLHGSSEAGAAKALGYPSVKAWLDANPGKTQVDALKEILAVSGITPLPGTFEDEPELGLEPDEAPIPVEEIPY